MNHSVKKQILCLLAASTLCADGANSFSPRSQSRDKTRQMVGTAEHVNLIDAKNWYANFAVTPVFEQTMRANKLAECLFGTSVNTCGQIKIQGSEIADRDAKAWLADYFYLAPDFDGTISVAPQIKNFLVDLDLFVGLDQYVCGAYVRIFAPITYTQWNLNFCEKITDRGNQPYTAGYFAPLNLPQTATDDQLLDSFCAYASGSTIGNGSVTQINTPPQPGGAPARAITTLFNPLHYAQISKDSRNQTGLADLRAELGWSFWHDDCHTASINIQGAAPTGTKRTACFLFDPYVGNGNHWELGGGLTMNHVIWNHESEHRYLNFYLDANITHLFSARQQRTFDLCGKENSRYMLAQKMGNPVDGQLFDLVAGQALNDIKSPSAQFQQEYTPVANLTTLDVNVSAHVQADIVALFNYTSGNWSIDFGYNFWGRSTEQIACAPAQTSCADQSLCTGQAHAWALKGDSRVWGNTSPSEEKIPLSATQSGATIFNGTNAAQSQNAQDQFYKANFGVDNPQLASDLIANTIVSIAGTQIQLKTSLDPILLSCDDIDFKGSRGISNKLFAHLSRNWDTSCRHSYLGIGGFVEFGKVSDSSTKNVCTDEFVVCDAICNTNTLDCAVSQWGIWLKAGVSFE